MTAPHLHRAPDDDESPAAVARALAPLTHLPEDVAALHLARLDAALAGGQRLAPRPRRAARRVGAAAAASAMAGVLLGGVGVAAASDAVPGDALYGLKTARERVVLAMAAPGEARARVHLELAGTRLDEAAELLRDGDARRAVEALARADAALAAATAHGSASVDAEADDAVERRVAVLTALLAGGLPDRAADAARDAIGAAVERDDRPAPGGPTRSPRPEPTRRPSDPPTATPDARPSERPDPARPSDRPTPHARPSRSPQAGPDRARPATAAQPSTPAGRR